MNACKERIETLRQLMKREGMDVFYVPMDDCHASEYAAAHFRCIEFMSGFTGSAANLVVDMEGAWLFTDGRYFIQAANQLEGSGIELMKMGEPGVPDMADFIMEKSGGKVLGFDGNVVPARFGLKFKGTVKYDRDLVDEVWKERPEQVFTQTFEMEEQYAGESVSSKLERIRKALKAELKKAGYDENGDYLYIINSLDDIAWTFNIRAYDIQNNPTPYAFAAITDKKATIYLGGGVVSPDFREKLNKQGAETGLYSPSCIYFDGAKTVIMDKSRINYGIYRYYSDKGCGIVDMENPSTLMKAVKNETEQKCLKASLARDSKYVVDFMYWLKTKAKEAGEGNRVKFPDGTGFDEINVADYLLEIRKKDSLFIEPSFETICAYGPNAAMMHYEAVEGVSNAEIYAKGMLLVDSGCQFKDGTTDITRTFVLGKLNDEEKKAFTLTAVSMLRLMNVKFIKGCTGENLDIYAREPMWENGMDYKCGTGHGVGHVLGVHEGPHNIRWGIRDGQVSAKLEEGMVVTDEPGVYRAGKFGIRTENELIVAFDRTTDDGTFLKFENLTFIPIDLDGIDIKYMNAQDIELLNNYHTSVYEKIAPMLADEEERRWLEEYTRQI